MDLPIILWFLGLAIMLLHNILPKKIKTVLVAIFIIIILLSLLPRQWFGKWNSISTLNNKEVSEIHLLPSEPNWKVNLIGRDFIITNKKQIDSITQLLRKTEVRFTGHRYRDWETKMIFITTTKDTFEIKIVKEKYDNYSTLIYTPTNKWRRDEVGNYLEKLTNYHQPVYSDTAKPAPGSIE